MKPRLCAGCAAVLVAVAGVLGCRSSNAAPKSHRVRTLSPSARPANALGLSTNEINQGAKLYAAKCARCHPLYDPGAYNNEEWHDWFAKMSKKAHLKTDQEELLSRYLGAFRAPQ